MTSEQFRRRALSLHAASEKQHMGHPDFRVGGKTEDLGFEGFERFGGLVLAGERTA